MEKRKLELAFIDKNGKVHQLDEVTRAELAEGLEKISKEIAKRLLLVERAKIKLAYSLFQEISGARV